MNIEIPKNVCFTCSQCGDCCRDLDIVLLPGERERLRSLDWSTREPSLTGVEPATRVAGAGKTRRLRLARTDDGRCIYLDDRNRCRIHDSFGADAKPLVCRLYPFSFNPIGDTIGVDVSYSCRAVANGWGAPVSDQLGPESALTAQAMAMTTPSSTRFLLEPGKRVDGAVMWEVERHLIGLIEVESLSLLDRVRCALQYLRLATTGDPGTAAASTLRTTMASALPRQIANTARAGALDQTQRAVFLLWLYLSLNPTPSTVHALPKRALQQEAERRAGDADRFRRREGRPWVDNRELDVSFGDVDRVGIGALNGNSQLLATFFRAKIVGQRFLFAGEQMLPMCGAVRRLLLCYPLIVWASKALAAERRALAVADDDVRAAVRLVDRSIGQIATSRLDAEQRAAWQYAIDETDLIEAATQELLGEGEHDERSAGA